jgi:hypothetical protein
MIKTTYTCDKCKTTKDPSALYTLNIQAVRLHHSTDYPLTPACGSAHWCIDCMRASNWFRTAETPAQPDPPPPASIETLIREMILSVMEENA